MRAGILDYSVAFFDFDGVIIDTVETKIDAFGELYEEFGDEVKGKVRDYQRQVPGETRFKKIPFFHRDYLGIQLSEDEVSEWCSRLTDIVLDRVIAQPLMAGALDTLQRLHRHGTKCFVVSGTPQHELDIIVAKKQLESYFVQACGSPRDKISIVADLKMQYDLDLGDALFIGDAISDLTCAQAHNLDFLGIGSENTHPFPDGTRVVGDLSMV